MIEQTKRKVMTVALAAALLGVAACASGPRGERIYVREGTSGRACRGHRRGTWPELCVGTGPLELGHARLCVDAGPVGGSRSRISRLAAGSLGP